MGFLSKLIKKASQFSRMSETNQDDSALFFMVFRLLRFIFGLLLSLLGPIVIILLIVVILFFPFLSVFSDSSSEDVDIKKEMTKIEQSISQLTDAEINALKDDSIDKVDNDYNVNEQEAVVLSAIYAQENELELEEAEKIVKQNLISTSTKKEKYEKEVEITNEKTGETTTKNVTKTRKILEINSNNVNQVAEEILSEEYFIIFVQAKNSYNAVMQEGD